MAIYNLPVILGRDILKDYIFRKERENLFASNRLQNPYCSLIVLYYFFFFLFIDFYFIFYYVILLSKTLYTYNTVTKICVMKFLRMM